MPIRAAAQDDLLKYWEEHAESPRQYIVDKFAVKDWVFLGEYHRIKHDVDFVADMIPLLHEKTGVRCLALEFLYHDDTEEANRLITAKTFDRRKAIHLMMRMEAGWWYEEYLRIFQSAWQSNRRHDKKDPFTLVGLEPTYDYEIMHFSTDTAKRAAETEIRESRDPRMASFLESDVLAKKRKALVYMGEYHTTAKYKQYVVDEHDQPTVVVRMGNMVYKEPYKDKMFFVRLHSPFEDGHNFIYPFNGRLDRLMKRFKKDIGFDVAGTPFSGLADNDPRPQTIRSYKLGELYDGYIIFREPMKETMGVTCIKDWVATPEEYRFFWRHLAKERAALYYGGLSFEEYLKGHCAPDDADYGAGFKRRFAHLPDLKN